MPRPPRFNADYYTHTADLRNDRRVKAIRGKFGAAGYGLLHMLLEVLTDADHTRLNTDALEIELLAGDFGVSATEIHALIEFAEQIGYFTRDSAGLLACPDLDKWLEPVFDKRNRSRNASTTHSQQQIKTETPVSVTEIPQSKVKESKVKERKDGGVEPPAPALAPLPSSSTGDATAPPAPQSAAPPRPTATYQADVAPVFERTVFNDFLRDIGYGYVDLGHYWNRILRKASDLNERTNKDWENYILKWLDNDANDPSGTKLVLAAGAKKGTTASSLPKNRTR